MNLPTRSILAVLTIFIQGPCFAFDVNGVKSGMTVSDLAAQVRASGFELFPFPDNADSVFAAALGTDGKTFTSSETHVVCA